MANNLILERLAAITTGWLGSCMCYERSKARADGSAGVHQMEGGGHAADMLGCRVKGNIVPLSSTNS